LVAEGGCRREVDYTDAHGLTERALIVITVVVEFVVIDGGGERGAEEAVQDEGDCFAE
jgi:hypothetical protein